MTRPLDTMIESAVSCCKCGTKGMWNCDCYVLCSCGFIADKGKPCNNPETTRCSTKMKYAATTTTLRKGERVLLIDAIGWSPVDALWTPNIGYRGTVAATPRKGSNDVSIRWDGRTSCDRINISWLEKVER